MNKAAEAGKDALRQDNLNPVANQTQFEPAAGASGQQVQIRVFIIDRHEAVRRALRVRLSVPQQFEIVGASPNTDAAAKQIQKKQPDVILLGLHTASDEELAHTVNAVQEMASMAAIVIVLAPYADAVERELLMKAGAKRYLLKHIDSDQLIREIEIMVASTADA
jgi:DNA-binding NarL/FixJ family response regulator